MGNYNIPNPRNLLTRVAEFKNSSAYQSFDEEEKEIANKIFSETMKKSQVKERATVPQDQSVAITPEGKLYPKYEDIAAERPGYLTDFGRSALKAGQNIVVETPTRLLAGLTDDQELRDTAQEFSKLQEASYPTTRPEDVGQGDIEATGRYLLSGLGQALPSMAAGMTAGRLAGRAAAKLFPATTKAIPATEGFLAKTLTPENIQSAAGLGGATAFNISQEIGAAQQAMEENARSKNLSPREQLKGAVIPGIAAGLMELPSEAMLLPKTARPLRAGLLGSGFEGLQEFGQTIAERSSPFLYTGEIPTPEEQSDILKEAGEGTVGGLLAGGFGQGLGALTDRPSDIKPPESEKPKKQTKPIPEELQKAWNDVNSKYTEQLVLAMKSGDQNSIMQAKDKADKALSQQKMLTNAFNKGIVSDKEIQNRINLLKNVKPMISSPEDQINQVNNILDMVESNDPTYEWGELLNGYPKEIIAAATARRKPEIVKPVIEYGFDQDQPYDTGVSIPSDARKSQLAEVAKKRSDKEYLNQLSKARQLAPDKESQDLIFALEKLQQEKKSQQKESGRQFAKDISAEKQQVIKPQPQMRIPESRIPSFEIGERKPEQTGIARGASLLEYALNPKDEQSGRESWRMFNELSEATKKESARMLLSERPELSKNISSMMTKTQMIEKPDQRRMVQPPITQDRAEIKPARLDTEINREISRLNQMIESGQMTRASATDYARKMRLIPMNKELPSTKQKPETTGRELPIQPASTLFTGINVPAGIKEPSLKESAIKKPARPSLSQAFEEMKIKQEERKSEKNIEPLAINKPLILTRQEANDLEDVVSGEKDIDTKTKISVREFERILREEETPVIVKEADGKHVYLGDQNYSVEKFGPVESYIKPEAVQPEESKPTKITPDQIVSTEDSQVFLHRTLKDSAGFVLKNGLKGAELIQGTATWEGIDENRAMASFNKRHRGDNAVVVIEVPISQKKAFEGKSKGETINDLVNAYLDKDGSTLPSKYIKGWIDRDTNEFHSNPSFYKNSNKESKSMITPPAQAPKVPLTQKLVDVKSIAGIGDIDTDNVSDRARSLADDILNGAARELPTLEQTGAFDYKFFDDTPDHVKQAIALANKIDPRNAEMISALVTDTKGKKAQERSDEKTADQKVGNKTEIHTPSGKVIKAHYEVVKISDLVHSGKSEFPMELQPRKRDFEASQKQINNIANNPIPEKVITDYPGAETGPMIVVKIGNRMIVLSGNGRTMGLEKAIQRGTFNKYSDALKAQSAKFGVKPIFNDSVLVRVLDGNFSTEELKKLSVDMNKSDQLQMSASESALADVDAIKKAIDSYQGGDIDLDKNSDFVSRFFRNSSVKNELPLYMTNSGALTKAGVDKISRALFAAAYGDSPLLQMYSEETDANIKSVLKQLIDFAPEMVKIQKEIDFGNLPDLSIAGSIAEAARKLSSIRKKGQTVDEFLANRPLFAEDDTSAIVRDIISMLDMFKRSSSKIGEVLSRYNASLRLLSSSNLMRLIEDEFKQPTRGELLEDSIRDVTGQKKTIITTQTGSNETVRTTQEEKQPKQIKPAEKKSELIDALDKIKKPEQKQAEEKPKNKEYEAKLLLNERPKNAFELIDLIINASRNFGEREIAKKVKEKLVGYDYEIPVEYTSFSDRMGGRVSGSERTGKILKVELTTKINSLLFDHGFMVPLHELIHATAGSELRLNKEFRIKVKKLMANIILANPEVKKRTFGESEVVVNGLKRTAYIDVLENEDEFMANALTLPEFQEFLKTVNIGEQTAWSKFVEMIMNFLGINKESKTAMEEVLSLYEKYAGTNKPTKTMNDLANTLQGKRSEVIPEEKLVEKEAGEPIKVEEGTYGKIRIGALANSFRSLISSKYDINKMAYSDKITKKELIDTTAKTFDVSPSEVTSENGFSMKVIQETYEAAMAWALLNMKGDVAKAKSLYEIQPTLGVRTGESVTNMAYSTPVIIGSAIADMLGTPEGLTVYEPTAGTGLLVAPIARDNKVYLNEINDLRLDILKKVFPKQTISSEDATKDVKIMEEADIVLANPPFGTIQEQSLKTTGRQIFMPMNKLEYIIAWKALENMKDNGRAVLIFGAQKEPGITGTQKRFMTLLYNQYNVKGHFEIDGDLYKQQGAAWPISVVVINGRQEFVSATKNKAPDSVTRFESWDDVIKEFSGLKEKMKYGNIQLQRPSDRSGAKRDGDTGKPSREVDTTLSIGGNADEQRGTRRTDTTSEPRLQSDMGRKLSKPETRSDEDTITDTGTTGKSEFDETRLPDEDVERAGTGRTDETSRIRKEKRDQVVRDRGALESSGLVNELQAKYQPQSKSQAGDNLVPTNLEKPLREALENLEDYAGKSIDDFVSEELGYKKTDKLSNYFSAEQIDAIGLAIKAAKEGKAIVNADQTGVGKGRTAAGMIVWAKKQGLIPVFVTEKAGLFQDIYRDLSDIGHSEMKPAIQNKKVSILDGEGKEIHKSLPDGTIITKELLKKGGYDFVATTYSQFPGASGAKKSDFYLKNNDLFFILDEAHNAAGDSQTGQKFLNMLEGNKNNGAYYLSATWAKTPANIPIFFMALDSNPEAIAESVAAGGSGMQEMLVSSMAVAGRYVRREQDFSGVTFRMEKTVDEKQIEKERSIADEVTSILLKIVESAPDIQELQDESQVGMDSFLDDDGNPVSGAVDDATPFSIVHNYIDQLLTALKVDRTVGLVADAVKSGQKPIIALKNTMESLMDAAGVKDGEVFGGTYKDLLERILLRMFSYSEKSLITNKVTRVYKQVKDLNPEELRIYNGIMELIKDADIPDTIYFSPIDAIKSRLQEKGISVSEITGRNMTIDYSGSKPLGKMRDAKDKTPSGRNKILADFNSGETDVLIINEAGATGLSAHSSPKFKDQRQRKMFILQPLSDINKFMQVLGRIHRKGQITKESDVISNKFKVFDTEPRIKALKEKLAKIISNMKPSSGISLDEKLLSGNLRKARLIQKEIVGLAMADKKNVKPASYGNPSYVYVQSGLDAERRLAIALQNKMKSLNAQTSSNEKGHQEVADIDIFNKYGDDVAMNVLYDLPMLDGLKVHSILLINPKTTSAKQITGRLALLPQAIQEEFWNNVVPEYTSFIDYLDATNSNDLKPLSMKEANAVTKSKMLLSDEGSPVYLEVNDITDKGSPVSIEIARKDITPISEETQDKIKQQFEKFKKYITEETALAERTGKGIKFNVKAIDSTGKSQIEDLVNGKFSPGNFVEFVPAIARGDRKIFGVISEVEFQGAKKETQNPLISSKIMVTINTPFAEGRIKIPLSKLAGAMFRSYGKVKLDAYDIIRSWNQEVEKGKTTVNPRAFLTGDVIKAQQFLKVKSEVALFQRDDGTLEYGWVLPKSYTKNPMEAVTSPRSLVSRENLADAYNQNYNALASSDRKSSIMFDNGNLNIASSSNIKKEILADKELNKLLAPYASNSQEIFLEKKFGSRKYFVANMPSRSDKKTIQKILEIVYDIAAQKRIFMTLPVELSPKAVDVKIPSDKSISAMPSSKRGAVINPVDVAKKSIEGLKWLTMKLKNVFDFAVDQISRGVDYAKFSLLSSIRWGDGIMKHLKDIWSDAGKALSNAQKKDEKINLSEAQAKETNIPEYNFDIIQNISDVLDNFRPDLIEKEIDLRIVNREQAEKIIGRKAIKWVKADSYNRVNGFIYDGKVYLVQGNIIDKSDLMKVFTHEVIGHYGVEKIIKDGLTGQTWESFISDLTKNIEKHVAQDSELKDIIGEQIERYNGLKITEVLAIAAEKGYGNVTLWEKIKSLVNRFLRKYLGMKKDLSLYEVKNVFASARQWAKDQNYVSEKKGMTFNSEIQLSENIVPSEKKVTEAKTTSPLLNALSAIQKIRSEVSGLTKKGIMTARESPTFKGGKDLFQRVRDFNLKTARETGNELDALRNEHFAAAFPRIEQIFKALKGEDDTSMRYALANWSYEAFASSIRPLMNLNVTGNEEKLGKAAELITVSPEGELIPAAKRMALKKGETRFSYEMPSEEEFNKVLNELTEREKELIKKRAEKNEEYRKNYVQEVLPMMNLSLSNQIMALYEKITKVRDTWAKYSNKPTIEKDGKIVSSGELSSARALKLEARYYKELKKLSDMLALNESDQGHYGYLPHVWAEYQGKFDMDDPRYKHFGGKKAKSELRRIKNKEGYLMNLFNVDSFTAADRIRAKNFREWSAGFLDEYAKIAKRDPITKQYVVPEGYAESPIIAKSGKFMNKLVFVPKEIHEEYIRANMIGNPEDESLLLATLNKQVDRARFWLLAYPSKFFRDLLGNTVHSANAMVGDIIRDIGDAEFSQIIPDIASYAIAGIKTLSPKEWNRLKAYQWGDRINDIASGLDNASPNVFGIPGKVSSWLWAVQQPVIQLANFFAVAGDVWGKRFLQIAYEQQAENRNLSGEKKDQWIIEHLAENSYLQDDLPRVAKLISKDHRTKGIVNLALYYTNYISNLIAQGTSESAHAIKYLGRSGYDSLVKGIKNPETFDPEYSKFGEMGTLGNVARKALMPWVWVLALMLMYKKEEEPVELIQELAPGQKLPKSVKITGRLPIGDNKFISIRGLGPLGLAHQTMKAVENAGTAKGIVKSATEFTGEVLSESALTNLAATLLNKTDKYDQYTPAEAIVGRELSNFLFPQMTRVGSDIKKFSAIKDMKPKRQPQDIWEGLASNIPFMPEEMQGKVLIDEDVKLKRNEPLEKMFEYFNPKDELLKLFGLNIKTVPEEKVNQVIENAKDRVEKLKKAVRLNKYENVSKQIIRNPADKDGSKRLIEAEIKEIESIVSAVKKAQQLKKS